MNDRLTNSGKRTTLNIRLALVILLLPLLVVAISTTAAQEDGPDGPDAEPRIVERIVMPSAVQTTIQFFATDDAFVSSAFPNSNFGSRSELRVGYDQVKIGRAHV